MQATGKALDALADSAGLKRYVESDDLLRARMVSYVRTQQGTGTKDGLFFELRTALPACGVVIVEEHLRPRPRFGFFARLFFRRLWRELKAEYTAQVTVYIYAPSGTPPIDASELVAAHIPVGVAFRIVLTGGARI